MDGSCPVCGLPKNICVCATISYEAQRIKVKLETKKWNRPTTVIEGLTSSPIDLYQLATDLKTKCACGGAVKNGLIILQGDQREKVVKTLIEMGLSRENIEVI
ncbi:MAG: stress response translation initiation inhibitor YciH [Aigarchaeota archaeon]|nr:stress response translation initiation inhibitor YciH [Aigarchaeota archaeon]MDW8092323.1 stress response translation initiation inhibitor YciH [Nitrososphaerota archaeon]